MTDEMRGRVKSVKVWSQYGHGHSTLEKAISTITGSCCHTRVPHLGE